MNRYRLIGVDPCPHGPGMQIVDRAYLVPFVDDPNYAARTEEILDAERPDFVVPLVDEEILIIHELAAARGINVVAPSVEFCQTMFGVSHATGDQYGDHQTKAGCDDTQPDHQAAGTVMLLGGVSQCLVGEFALQL